MISSYLVPAVLAGSLVTVVTGCASRDVPQRYPETSAASSEAAEAPGAVVTRALDGEPPLPGSSMEGWAGLAPTSGAASSSGASGHAGHAGHQHGAPSHQQQPQPAQPQHEDEHEHEQGAHHGH